MIINENSKNKQEVKAFLIKFRIKKIIISTYYLQINDIVRKLVSEADSVNNKQSMKTSQQDL